MPIRLKLTGVLLLLLLPLLLTGSSPFARWTARPSRAPT